MRPVLELATTYEAGLVSFLSGCAVLSMAVVTLTRRRRQVEFDLRRGTALAIGSACGGVAGKLIFDSFGKETLGMAQAILMAVIALGLLIHVFFRNRLKPKDIHSLGPCLLLGLVLGVVSVFLGIGGGPLNLAALTYFLGLDLKKSAVYSLYIIIFSQAASFLLMLILGNVPAFSWPVLVCAIAGGIGGGLVGSWIGGRIREKALGYLYTSVLIFVLIVSVLNLRAYIH